MTRLWDVKHPYYATEGCYYVSGTLGHGGTNREYDGNVCHANYKSWAAFKAGDAEPFSAEILETRRAHGIKEPTPEEEQRQRAAFGKWSFYTADEDYNLLYRWDWFEPGAGDLEEGEAPYVELKLFYMLQRKARPSSVHVRVTREDEPEIRSWLADKWRHMQRLWSPFGPDIAAETPAHERAELTLDHYARAARDAEREALTPTAVAEA
jgi:hypothetical protein